MEGMWHSDEQMFDDEVVTDGAPHPCKRVQFPQQTSENKYISKNTDSGFISGVSINEDSSSGILCSSDNLASREVSSSQTGMKIDSSTRCSDSGLGLEYPIHSCNDLNSQTSLKPCNKDSPRRITLADLLRQDDDGDTPLHLAVLQGFIEVVFSLVRILSDPRFLEIPNKKLQSPLHLAVLTNQAPLVRRLVVGGASVLLRDRHGNTPLHLACRDGSVDCARALLFPVSQEERQAALLPPQAIPQPLPQDLEQRNYDGQMPLHLSVMNGHVHIARLLFRFGANINAVEGKYGRTALHYAVERRQPALLHYLVTEWGAMTEAETYSGYTAYQLAVAGAPMLAILLADLGVEQRPSPSDKITSSSSDEDDQMSDSEVSWRPKDMNLGMINEVLHLAA